MTNSHREGKSYVSFKVNGNEYKVKFTHRLLAEDNLLDDLFGYFEGKNATNDLSGLIKLTAALLLAGLQKFHADEFGYSTEAEKREKTLAVYDLLDDFDDEHAQDEMPDGEERPSSASVFNDLEMELQKNGFLARLFQTAKQMEQVEEIKEKRDSKKKAE